jgi:hypothetical protein
LIRQLNILSYYHFALLVKDAGLFLPTDPARKKPEKDEADKSSGRMMGG